MKTLLTVCCLCLIPSVALAQRGGTPPTSITVKMAGFTGGDEATRHNGTFLLTPTVKGKITAKDVDWVYLYEDKTPGRFTVWCVTINRFNNVTVIAGSGQGPMGVFTTTSDIYLVNSVPQANGLPLDVLVTAK